MADCKQVEVVLSDGQPFPSTRMRVACADNVEPPLGPGVEGNVLTTHNGQAFWSASPQQQFRSLIWHPGTSTWIAENHSYRGPPIVNLPGWPAGSPNIRLSFAQNNLLDSSGNGLNASVEAGTQRFTYFSPTISCFKFDGSTVLTVAGSQALLALTGAMTCAFSFILRSVGTQQFLIGYDDLGETEADNTLYSLFYEASGSISYISESGAGVNFQHNVNSWAEVGQPSLGGFTRYSDGTVQLFLNQGAWGNLSAVGPLPTGGGNARFRMGGREALTAPFSGSMSAVCIWPFSITTVQWKELYNATFGPWQGFTDDT